MTGRIVNLVSKGALIQFKDNYYCKFIVARRTQASKPRPLIQKDT